MVRRNGMRAALRAGASAAVLATVLAAILATVSGSASAQSGGGPLNFLDGLFTGNLSKGNPGPNQPAQAPAGGPQPWSGEDGASGHPLMTAAAIREAAGNFDACVASTWPDAARRNI